jgi:glucosamine-6-phosphate deaminase
MNDVPNKAITMTPYQIMQCSSIISAVPTKAKSQAIKKLLECKKINPMLPATLLKTHNDCHLFLDKNSASACNDELLMRYK